MKRIIEHLPSPAVAALNKCLLHYSKFRSLFEHYSVFFHFLEGARGPLTLQTWPAVALR